MAKNYWLFKSEPDVYPIQALAKEKGQTTYWDGIRNYQSRNTLRDDVQVGDGILYYHSRVNPMAVVGTAVVTRAGYPDPTQFDPKEKKDDPKSKKDDPTWFVVDIKLDQVFETPVTLKEMRDMKPLAEMVLVNNSRLSVQPVRKKEWNAILKRGMG